MSNKGNGNKGNRNYGNAQNRAAGVNNSSQNRVTPAGNNIPSPTQVVGSTRSNPSGLTRLNQMIEAGAFNPSTMDSSNIGANSTVMAASDSEVSRNSNRSFATNQERNVPPVGSGPPVPTPNQAPPSVQQAPQPTPSATQTGTNQGSIADPNIIASSSSDNSATVVTNHNANSLSNSSANTFVGLDTEGESSSTTNARSGPTSSNNANSLASSSARRAIADTARNGFEPRPPTVDTTAHQGQPPPLDVHEGQFRALTNAVSTPVQQGRHHGTYSSNDGQTEPFDAHLGYRAPSTGSSSNNGNLSGHKRSVGNTDFGSGRDAEHDDHRPSHVPYRGGNYNPFGGHVPSGFDHPLVNPRDTQVIITSWVDYNHIQHDFTWLDVANDDPQYALQLFDARLCYFGLSESMVRGFRGLQDGSVHNWISTYTVEELDRAFHATAVKSNWYLAEMRCAFPMMEPY
eukprot:gene28516-32206_t